MLSRVLNLEKSGSKDATPVCPSAAPDLPNPVAASAADDSRSSMMSMKRSSAAASASSAASSAKVRFRLLGEGGLP